MRNANLATREPSLQHGISQKGAVMVNLIGVKLKAVLILSLVFTTGVNKVASAQTAPALASGTHSVERVLLLSLDGLHALDLANYIKAKPDSNLAQLSQHGITYTNAHSSLPSNSWPGLLAIVTGGSPLWFLALPPADRLRHRRSTCGEGATASQPARRLGGPR